MTPQKQILEAADKAAKEYALNEAVIDDGTDEGQGLTAQQRVCAEWGHRQGVEWLFNHLCELSEQEITLDDLAGDYSAGAEEQRVFNEGKRRQHTLDHAALLKARSRIKELENMSSVDLISEKYRLREELKAAKRTIQKQKEYVGDKAEEIIAAKQEIANLKSDLRDTHEAYVDNLKDDKPLHDRMKELEAALDQLLDEVEDMDQMRIRIVNAKEALKGSAGEG